MKFVERAARIVWVDGAGLLASDVRGGLHLLNDDFTVRLSRRHPVNSYANYALTISGDDVFTRDMVGNVTKWRLSDLQIMDSIAADRLRGNGEYLPGEVPSQVISRGICVWEGSLYLNNGFLELVQIDPASFEVLSVEPSFSSAWLEWFCTDREGQQAVADKQGNLFIGDLKAKRFDVQLKIDKDLNLHRVVFDPRHDRFWVTQDAGEADDAYIANGVVVVAPSGELLYDFKFAADDVEALVFNSDFTLAFAGGFDGEIVVFDNTDAEPRIVHRFAGFSHQITDLTMLPNGNLVVLCQDGQLYEVSQEGKIENQSHFDTRCVWDIQSTEPHSFVCATDDGLTTITVANVESTHPSVRVGHHLSLGIGFIRRVRPLADGSFAVIGRSSVVTRVDADGHQLWLRSFDPHVHDLSVSHDEQRLICVSNEGAHELSLKSGETLRSFDLGGAVPWTCHIAENNSVVIGTRDGRLLCFDTSSDPVWATSLGGYCKRMIPMDKSSILVTGGGFGVVQVTLADGSVVGRWSEGLENTVENALELDGQIYASSYGRQLGIYAHASGELLGTYEALEDFPKALAAIRTPSQAVLLVGGRGGFLQVRVLDATGDPQLVGTTYRV